MLQTRKRRIWLVLSVLWVIVWFALYARDAYPAWPGFFIVAFGPVALGWGLFVGLPAMIRWIRAGK